MKDLLIFSIRLASGDFQSELQLPLPRTKEEREQVVAHWLDFMRTGLRLGAESMDAVLGEPRS